MPPATDLRCANAGKCGFFLWDVDRAEAEAAPQALRGPPKRPADATELPLRSGDSSCKRHRGCGPGSSPDDSAFAAVMAVLDEFEVAVPREARLRIQAALLLDRARALEEAEVGCLAASAREAAPGERGGGLKVRWMERYRQALKVHAAALSSRSVDFRAYFALLRPLPAE